MPSASSSRNVLKRKMARVARVATSLCASLALALALVSTALGSTGDDNGLYDSPKVFVVDGEIQQVADEEEATFTPTQTGAYELVFDGMAGDGGLRVYFYERSLAEPDDGSDSSDDSDGWNRIDYCDIQGLDFYSYPFFAQAGKTYKFAFSFIGDTQSASARLVRSTKAGITPDGLSWRTQRVRPAGSESYYDSAVLIKAPKQVETLTVPGSVGGFPLETVGDWALDGCEATSIVVEEGVKAFMNYVNGTEKLTSVSLPSTLEDIHNNPFRLHNPAGIKVDFPNGSDHFAVWGSYLVSTGNYPTVYSYLGNTNLTELVVPDGVRRIFWWVFDGSAVKKLTLPASVEDVGGLDANDLRELHLRNGNCVIYERTMPREGGDYGSLVYCSGAAVYAPAGGVTESLCGQLGLPFVAEGGSVPQFYTIYEEPEYSPEDDLATVAESRIYPYQGLWYGTFTPSKSGVYRLLFGEDGTAAVESAKDSQGRALEATAESSRSFLLTAGETYTFAFSFNYDAYSAYSFRCTMAYVGDEQGDASDAEAEAEAEKAAAEAAEKAAADQAAAKKVEDTIAALPNADEVTADNAEAAKAAAEAAQGALDALTDDQRALVSDEAKAKLEAVKAAADKAIAGKAAAQSGDSDGDGVSGNPASGDSNFGSGGNGNAGNSDSGDNDSASNNGSQPANGNGNNGSQPANGNDNSGTQPANGGDTGQRADTVSETDGTATAGNPDSGQPVAGNAGTGQPVADTSKPAAGNADGGSAASDARGTAASGSKGDGPEASGSDAKAEAAAPAKGEALSGGSGATKASYTVSAPYDAKKGYGELVYKRAMVKKSAKKATVPATTEIDGKTYRVVEIADKAFRDLPKLKTVKVGKNVKKVGKWAFKNSKNVTKLSGFSGVTELGRSAFYGLKKVKTVPSMPKLKKVGAYAFRSCTALKSYTAGKKVTSIGQGAFKSSGVTKLTVKSKKLKTKKAVSKCLSKSKVKTVKLSGLGSSKSKVKKAFKKYSKPAKKVKFK